MAQPKIQSNQLTNTGVTPGSYTTANITVDAAGRITAAATGTAGAIYTAGNLINPTLLATNQIAVRDVGVSPVGGNNNIFIGPGAGTNFTTGTGNVVIGALAGDTATQGSNNVLIGIEAGHGVTTGTNNILIGYQAGRKQTENGEGNLSDSFIINNELIRDPEIYPPYLRGRMLGDNSTLQLAGSFFIKAIDDSILFGLTDLGEFELDGDPGVAGQVLTSGGVGAPVTWAAGGGSPGGGNRQVQFNNLGVFGADDGFVYNEGGSFTIGVPNTPESSTDFSYYGIQAKQDFDINAGPGRSAGLWGGSGNVDENGGVVYLAGGNGSGVGAGGTVFLQPGTHGGDHPDFPGTGNIEFQIPDFNVKFSKDLKINDDPGTAGQVLTSGGPDVAPTWQAGGGGGGVPGGTDTQIQFNNAGAFGGDARFTWEAVGGGNLKLGVPGGFAMITTPDSVDSSTANLLIIAGASGPTASIASSLTLQGGLASSGVAAGGNVTIETVNVADSTGAAGNVLIRGGVGGTDAPGGSISILGGAHGGFSSGNSGSVTIRGGRNAGTGNTGNVILGGISNLALATNATGGFVTIPSCAGVPTGVPAPAIPTGQVAMVFDTTNNRLYARNTTWVNLSAVPAVIQVAASDETTALTAGVAKVTFRLPHAMTLTSVRASLTTAQTSGTIFTVDIKENGTSIMATTKITIDNTEKTSTTAVALPVLTDITLADDAEITVDIIQIGDGTAKGLKVTLIGTR